MTFGMKKRESRRGFTLVELMIVMAILAILMLILFAIWMSMIRATRLVDAKVKMRDESRQALQHMTSNLRMAGFNNENAPTTIQYDNGTAWPPPSDVTDLWSDPVSSISFIRPVAEADGMPFVAGSHEINWSELVTYQLDVTDANGDNDFLQLVQLNGPVGDQRFVRLLASNISDFDSGNATIYDVTPSADPTLVDRPFGVEFRAGSVSEDDSVIWISIIQRRSLGPGMPWIVTRYDDYVDVEN
ncbi:MAG: type II secretion system protein [Candidatus Hydrogenedentota bacterium]